jgi:phage shock protein A
MASAGMTLDRAQDKIAQMQARSGAIDELLDTGALPDALGGGDDIQRELEATSQQNQVDTELAALKAQLGAGAAGTGELTEGNGTPDGGETPGAPPGQSPAPDGPAGSATDGPS